MAEQTTPEVSKDDPKAKKPKIKTHTGPLFTLKKWNAVAMWSWDVECDTCAICRVQVMGEYHTLVYLCWPAYFQEASINNLVILIDFL